MGNKSDGVKFLELVPQMVEQINVTITEDKKYDDAAFQITNLLFMFNNRVNEMTLFEIFETHKEISKIRFDIIHKFIMN